MGQDNSSSLSRKSRFSIRKTNDIDRTPAFFVTVKGVTKLYNRTSKKKNGRAVFSFDSTNSIEWVKYGCQTSWILSWDGRFKYLNDFEERMSQKITTAELKGHWWVFAKTKNDWDWRYSLKARVVSVSHMLQVTRALVSMFENFGLSKLMADIVIDMLDEDHMYEMLRKRKKIRRDSCDLNPSESKKTRHLRKTSDMLPTNELTVIHPIVRETFFSL